MIKYFIFELLLLQLTLHLNIPKKIWLFLEDGIQQSNSVVKLCVNQLRINALNDNWQMILLTKHNLHQYLVHVPQKKGIVEGEQTQTYSDVIRLHIIAQHGGVYVDATIIQLESFKWIFDLNNNDQIVNRYGQEPQALLFFTDIHAESFRFVEINNQSVYPNLGYENWFIAAVPSAQIIKDWRDQLQLALKMGHTYLDKYIDHSNFQYGHQIKTNLYYRYHLVAYFSIYTVIQRKQNQLDKVGDFAVQHYKLWAINASNGPLIFTVTVPEAQSIVILTTVPYYYLFYFRNIRYFIKLTSYLHKQINNIIQAEIKQPEITIIDQPTYKNLWNPPCKVQIKQKKIIKNSFVETFLIQYSEQYKKKLQPILPQTCQQNNIILTMLLMLIFVSIFSFIPFLIFWLIEIAYKCIKKLLCKESLKKIQTEETNQDIRQLKYIKNNNMHDYE